MTEAKIQLAPQQIDLLGSKEHDIIVSGSAGSGKSFWAALHTILYAQNTPGALLLVTRKYGPQLWATCRKQIIDLLDMLHIPYTPSGSFIIFGNGARIHFNSIHSLYKFRSTEYDYIWIEQAEEIHYLDYQELMRRLRGKVGGNKKDPRTYLQCVITATPEDEVHWMYKMFYKGEIDEDREYHPVHFDYKQNIHLPEEYIRDLERLKKVDPELYNKYALGLWGKISNTIYPNWNPCDRIPLPGTAWERMPRPDYIFAGADWGYNNPSAFVLMGFDGKHIFILDEVYKTKLTNPEFLKMCEDKCKEWNIEPIDLDVWGDAAEPDRIEEFKRAGFNIMPGTREPLRRIDTVKRQTVYYSPVCVKTIEEVKDYKWMVDKDNEVLDRPVKFNDHAMDAVGYGVVGMVELYGKVVPTDPYLIVGGGGYEDY